MIPRWEIPVVILAGGEGARFDHESEVMPKPLIRIDGTPILQHIMDSFTNQGFREFIILGGYMVEEIHRYFSLIGTEYSCAHGFPVPSGLGRRWWMFRISPIDTSREIDVTVVDTDNDGGHVHTGMRLWNARKHIEDRRFILTYGDGLSDVQMADVLRQHEETGAGVTITAVRPPGRFGVIRFADPFRDCRTSPSLVESIDEKPADGWINGGFMVVDPQFITQYIEGEFELESTALPELAASGGLFAYRHEGYWRCMDTRRDRQQIELETRKYGRLWLRLR